MEESILVSKLFSGSGLSPELLEDVKQATISALGLICNEKPQYVGMKENGALEDVIVGIMSLVSKELALSLHLGFSQDAAVVVAKRFARCDIPFASSDMNDVIGELTNIFTGDISGRLEVWGIKSDLSIPTVARGKELELLLPAKSPAVCLLFKFSFGQFWVKIGIGRPEPNK